MNDEFPTMQEILGLNNTETVYLGRADITVTKHNGVWHYNYGGIKEKLNKHEMIKKINDVWGMKIEE